MKNQVHGKFFFFFLVFSGSSLECRKLQRQKCPLQLLPLKEGRRPEVGLATGQRGSSRQAQVGVADRTAGQGVAKAAPRGTEIGNAIWKQWDNCTVVLA